MVIHVAFIQQSGYQPGMVANPARGNRARPQQRPPIPGTKYLCIAHVHCTSRLVFNGCGKREADINWSMGLPD